MTVADDAFNKVVCIGCGITFKFLKEVEDAWRRSNKTFHCPNGCSLSWPKQPTEVVRLQAEVEKLKKEIVSLTEDLAKQKQRANQLALDLEIWKPAETA